MASMMDMGLRRGQGAAGIGGSIGRGLDMVLVYIDFILGMFMLGNGQMGRVMGVEFILARMVAGMWASSSGVSSMAWVTTTSGMETRMLGNTLLIKCMALGFILLQMATVMKEPGMRAEDKDLECTLSGMGKLSQGTGKMGFWMSLAHRMRPILYHLLLFTIPRCSMQFRKHAVQQIKLMMWPRWMRE